MRHIIIFQIKVLTLVSKQKSSCFQYLQASSIKTAFLTMAPVRDYSYSVPNQK